MSLQALRGDTIRKKGKYKFHYVIVNFFFDRTFRPIVTLRICQATRGNIVLLPIHYFFRFLHRWSSNRAGIDLPWNTNIATGFTMTHGWGIVINKDAVIGKNVTLFNGVTIGRRDIRTPDGKIQILNPVIEDEVWVGPHAIIVGGITIGKGSRIAGGSFVIESVPPYSAVVGNPSKIIKSNATPEVYNRVPEDF